eukprot:CAMPEP_0172023470 /NCGR_PEP_ID=MMETSP1041-20130122/14808_1 /TAXON_ID=464988 /ORGANISM="Hemiselmis andersenii, Strain CCMP439" /LENGTH=35 /DNA_ID= /DNA_START= /DNA_END= /DNA_ORIENTATION=
MAMTNTRNIANLSSAFSSSLFGTSTCGPLLPLAGA